MAIRLEGEHVLPPTGLEYDKATTPLTMISMSLLMDLEREVD